MGCSFEETFYLIQPDSTLSQLFSDLLSQPFLPKSVIVRESAFIFNRNQFCVRELQGRLENPWYHFMIFQLLGEILSFKWCRYFLNASFSKILEFFQKTFNSLSERVRKTYPEQKSENQGLEAWNVAEYVIPL